MGLCCTNSSGTYDDVNTHPVPDMATVKRPRISLPHTQQIADANKGLTEDFYRAVMVVNSFFGDKSKMLRNAIDSQKDIRDELQSEVPTMLDGLFTVTRLKASYDSQVNERMRAEKSTLRSQLTRAEQRIAVLESRLKNQAGNPSADNGPSQSTSRYPENSLHTNKGPSTGKGGDPGSLLPQRTSARGSQEPPPSYGS